MKANREANENVMIILLESLKAVPPRSEIQVEEGRTAFLRTAGGYRARGAAVRSGGGGWRTLGEVISGQTLTLRRAAMAALLALVVLLSGTAVTVSAAHAALPGEDLYSLKLWLEKAQLAISLTSMGDLRLNLAHAQRRIEEINTIGGPSSAGGYDLAKAGLAASLQAGQGLFDELSGQGGNQPALSEIGTQLDIYWSFLQGLDGEGGEVSDPPTLDESDSDDEFPPQDGEPDEEEDNQHSGEQEPGEEHDVPDGEEDDAEDDRPESDPTDEHDDPDEHNEHDEHS